MALLNGICELYAGVQGFRRAVAGVWSWPIGTHTK